MKKVILTETLFLRKKARSSKKTNLVVNLLELIQEGYDADYEVNRIQTFISKSKDRQLKKSNKKFKKLEDKIETLTGETTK